PLAFAERLLVLEVHCRLELRRLDLRRLELGTGPGELGGPLEALENRDAHADRHGPVSPPLAVELEGGRGEELAAVRRREGDARQERALGDVDLPLRDR